MVARDEATPEELEALALANDAVAALTNPDRPTREPNADDPGMELT